MAVRTVHRCIAFDTSLGFPRGATAPPEAAGGHLYTRVQAPHSLVLESGRKEHPPKWWPHPDFAHVSLSYFPPRPLAVPWDSRILILVPIIPPWQPQNHSRSLTRPHIQPYLPGPGPSLFHYWKLNHRRGLLIGLSGHPQLFARLALKHRENNPPL